MNAAERSAKNAPAPLTPKGVIQVPGPDGETMVYVRAPRGPGPWFRVKHLLYGHQLIKADSPEQAVQKYFEKFDPLHAADPAWVAKSSKDCRVQRLPDPAPSEPVTGE